MGVKIRTLGFLTQFPSIRRTPYLNDCVHCGYIDILKDDPDSAGDI